MLKASPTPAPPIFYQPVEGLEVEETTYMQWLLAGGAPIPRREDGQPWEDTVRDPL